MPPKLNTKKPLHIVYPLLNILKWYIDSKTQIRNSFHHFQYTHTPATLLSFYESREMAASGPFTTRSAQRIKYTSVATIVGFITRAYAGRLRVTPSRLH